MEFLKRLLKAVNSLVTALIVCSLLISGLYAGYSLWDNYRVYAKADKVQSDMLRYKPDINADDGGESIKASFEDLQIINKDVCAWLTIDNTNIDYPILQGEDNYAYINTDVYGDFSLAGSIFLDYRCSSDFSDPYNLVYGHHISNGKMFGDLDKFKKQSFFDKNKTGTLITPEKVYRLEIFAVFVVGDSEPILFNPRNNTDANKLLTFTENHALYSDKNKVSEIRKKADTAQIISLSTCASEFTDARTVVVALMVP